MGDAFQRVLRQVQVLPELVLLILCDELGVLKLLELFQVRKDLAGTGGDEGKVFFSWISFGQILPK